MRWRIQNDFTGDQQNPYAKNISAAIEDEENQIVCVISKEVEKFRFNAELIENAPEMYEAIQSFVNGYNGINGNTLKPAQACKQFEKILERVNRYK